MSKKVHLGVWRIQSPLQETFPSPPEGQYLSNLEQILKPPLANLVSQWKCSDQVRSAVACSHTTSCSGAASHGTARHGRPLVSTARPAATIMDIVYMKPSHSNINQTSNNNSSDNGAHNFISENLGVALSYLILISIFTVTGCFGNVLVIGAVVSSKVREASLFSGNNTFARCFEKCEHFLSWKLYEYSQHTASLFFKPCFEWQKCRSQKRKTVCVFWVRTSTFYLQGKMSVATRHFWGQFPTDSASKTDSDHFGCVQRAHKAGKSVTTSKSITLKRSDTRSKKNFDQSISRDSEHWVRSVSDLSSAVTAQPLRTVANMFVVNLALADLGVTCFVNPFSIIGA